MPIVRCQSPIGSPVKIAFAELIYGITAPFKYFAAIALPIVPWSLLIAPVELSSLFEVSSAFSPPTILFIIFDAIFLISPNISLTKLVANNILSALKVVLRVFQTAPSLPNSFP